MGSSDPCLLLIDVQRGFDEPRWGPRNNPGAEANIARLIEAWRRTGRPIVHVRHHSRLPQSPLGPDQPGAAFKPEALPEPDEPIYTKDVNSAFIGTTLDADLRARGATMLVVAGLTTDHCVSTTVRMGANLGYRVWVAADACATFDRADHTGRPLPAEDVHRAALASLHGEFATVADTEALIGPDIRWHPIEQP
jgi:nicotinamidase-related amidase